MLKDQLREQLKQSMLAQDSVKTSTLRMLISAIGYFEIQKGGAGYSATDEEVLAVIQKEVNQRRDSIEQFEKGNRADLVEKETKELHILKDYLPEQMTDEQITALVTEAVKSTNSVSISDFGKVMGQLMPKVKGKADGTVVSNIVKQILSQEK